jgi:predicted nucleic acid-binding protein
MIVFLDTNILGSIANPNIFAEESQASKKWFENLIVRGARVVTSTICDYEIRRGLIAYSIRVGRNPPGLVKLDELRTEGILEFLPVSTEALDLAAALWARASTEGRGTRDDRNIDVDIIISAQYQILREEFPGRKVVVATTNLKHLSLFCDAAEWQDIEF